MVEKVATAVFQVMSPSTTAIQSWKIHINGSNLSVSVVSIPIKCEFMYYYQQAMCSFSATVHGLLLHRRL